MHWYSRFYTIGSRSIVSVDGVITKKIDSQDIRVVSRIAVEQGLWGRLCKYGDIIVESPLLQNPVIMKNIADPESWEIQIKKYHEKALQKNPFSVEETARLYSK